MFTGLGIHYCGFVVRGNDVIGRWTASNVCSRREKVFLVRSWWPELEEMKGALQGINTFIGKGSRKYAAKSKLVVLAQESTTLPTTRVIHRINLAFQLLL